jgi:LysR family transcriptional regulator, regulator for metE and metH
VEIMLQLTALQRGVVALPDWLAQRATQTLGLKSLRLGRQGMSRSLYAAYRDEDAAQQYLQAFLEVASTNTDS